MKMRTNKAVSGNTERKYKAQWSQFCGELRAKGKSDEMPISEPIILDWLSGVIEDMRLSADSVRSMFSAVDFQHDKDGYRAPCRGSAKLINAVRNYRRDLAGARADAELLGVPVPAAAAKHNKAPLRSEDIRKLQKRIPLLARGWHRERDMAVVALMWSGALRRSEAAALTVDDVQITDKGVEIRIRKSKGDQLGRGAKILAPHHKKLLVVSVGDALQRWLEVRAGLGVRSASPSLFLFSNANALAAAMRIRIDSQFGSEHRYSSHSFRIGMATELTERGVALTTIQMHLRHSNPNVTAGYCNQAQGMSAEIIEAMDK